ncbi:MAG: VOC family protein [Rubrivivax sp.]
MHSFIANVTLLVHDYDEAIAFYRDALGFDLLEDKAMGAGKRWVRMAPPGGQGAALLLARAADDEQRAQVGHQSGGRVFLFLHTGDFDGTVARLPLHGGQLTETVRHETYGRVVVFLDRYGNKWDLIEPVAD